MKIKTLVAGVLSLGALLFAGAPACRAAVEKAPGDDEICLIDVRQIPRMSVDELQSRLSDPSLVLIDIRAASDWEASSSKIKGAFRETYGRAEEWMPKYDKDKTIVLYCS